jgi:hypothetical protein
MQRFVANYPEFTKASKATTKHTTITSELSRQVGKYMIMEVSEMEQNLVAGEITSDSAASKIIELLQNEQVRWLDKQRLVLLFRLRFEPDPSAVSKAKDLEERLLGLVPPDEGRKCEECIKKLLQFGGAERRSADLFQKGGLLKEIKKMKRSIKECDNVYTQHIPHLRVLLDQLSKAKLSTTQYPFTDASATQMDRKTMGSYKPQEVVVFIAGGVTYEEAASVAAFTQQNPSMQVVLGGNTILRTQSFLDDIDKL